MKISASSYSFDQKLRTGELTQLDCIKKTKEMGFDAIELVGLATPEGMSCEEYADRLREECEREALPVSNYTVSADFLGGSGGDLDAEVERVCREVDIAVRLGAVSMRHDAGWGLPAGSPSYWGFADALPRMAEGCRRVTEYAAKRGVRTMCENHGLFAQDSERVEQLVRAVGHENFGLLADMGNFLCADESPAKAFGRIASYVRYVHAKDFIVRDGERPDPGEGFFQTRAGNRLRGTIVGHCDVPVKPCLSVLKRAGFDGYVALEFEGPEDAYTALRIGLANLRRYIAEL